MNECHFLGNLVRDPELKNVGAKKVACCNLSIAVNRRFKRGDEWVSEASFLDLVAWDSGAEAIDKHFSKGDPIIVHCSVQQESWDDKDTGKKRSKLTFRVNKFEFVPGRKKGESDDAPEDDNDPRQDAPADAPADDDDVPF